MGKYKKTPMYNILSMRVSEEEKEFMSEISRTTRKSVSKLMREAIHHYCVSRDLSVKTG